jgi:predicted metalloprotease
MQLNDERDSDNIEDRRGDAGGFSLSGGHIGIGGVVLALVVSYFTGGHRAGEGPVTGPWVIDWKQIEQRSDVTVWNGKAK